MPSHMGRKKVSKEEVKGREFVGEAASMASLACVALPFCITASFQSVLTGE